MHRLVAPGGDEPGGGDVLLRHIPVEIIEPQPHVERQLADRPLILHEQGRRGRAIVLLPSRRDVVRHAGRAQAASVRHHARSSRWCVCVERVTEQRVVGDAPLQRLLVGALIAELDVVRAGHVRGRRAPVVRIGVVVGPSEAERIEGATIREVRRMALNRCDLGHGNQVDSIRRRLTEAVPDVMEPREARFEQKLVRDRRVPRRLRDVVRRVVIARPRLRRRRRATAEVAEPDPIRLGAATAALGAQR